MRDQKLFEILDDDPRKAFSFIKSNRTTTPRQIESLVVGTKVYHGAQVPDGFYDSMSSIKTCRYDRSEVDPQFAEHLANHDHILALCKNKCSIPQIDIATSTSLLKRMKKNVYDIFSVSPLHYLNAGEEGLAHFNFILNAIISNVNNAKLDDMNLVLGLILWKGHKKDKNSDRSYRTISTCPLLAKATDMYIRDLYNKQWNTCQAPTQYQGEGSSHELAALLVTEVIQHSLHVSELPIFPFSLDAQSAFDRCHRQILSTKLYKAGMDGSALAYIDNRLSSRSTVYHWEGNMMGPAKDDTGFEQGGVSSSDFYKLYNNEQLTSTQRSGLGVDIKSSVISSIGQADDVIHVANTIDDLHLLATITEQYCAKFKVTLVPTKTKLLVFSNENDRFKVDLAKITNPFKISNVPVEFCSEAEHVGILRSTSGNMPNILNRIACHKRSLGAILSAGLARGHRSNPTAALRVHQIYETPILFNGLAALYLSKSEVSILDSHFLCTLQNLQRLHNKTPRAVVLFMAGSLPGEAILHLRQLSLFSMICRLPADPLHVHARYVLTRLPRSCKSWFHLIRDVCLQYSLPHPLQLLEHPPTKQSFKAMAKTNVIHFWENRLAQEAHKLPSLTFFNTDRLSLRQPSILWLMAGSNSFENSKSSVVAKMVSGRYRSDFLTRHWNPANKEGFCLETSCVGVRGDLVHMLTVCPGLRETRDKLTHFLLKKSEFCPTLYNIIVDLLHSPPHTQTQFLLDPCQIPAISSLCISEGAVMLNHIFYLTRTFAYYMHRAKMISHGRWPGDPGRKPKRLARKLPGLGFKKQITLTDSTIVQHLNLSVAGSVEVSRADRPALPVVTWQITTSLPTANMMTGPTCSSAVTTTGGGTIVVQEWPVFSPHSAQQSFSHTDNTTCYNSTLQAMTLSPSVPSPCPWPCIANSQEH